MMASWWAAADLLDSLEENSIVSQVIQAVGLFGDILLLEDTMEPMLFGGKKAVEEGDDDEEEEKERVENEGGHQQIEDWVDKYESEEEEEEGDGETEKEKMEEETEGGKAGEEFGIEEEKDGGCIVKETKMEAVHEDDKEEEKMERKDKGKSQGVESEEDGGQGMAAEVEKDTGRQDEQQQVEDDEDREDEQDVKNEQKTEEDGEEAVKGGSEDRGAEDENEEEVEGEEEEEKEKLKTQGEDEKEAEPKEEREDDRAESKEQGENEKDEEEETESVINPAENIKGPSEESENESDPSLSQRIPPPQDPESAETLTSGTENEDSKAKNRINPTALSSDDESEDVFLSSSNASSQTAAAESVMDTDLSGSDVCLVLSEVPAQSSREQQQPGHPGETPEDTRELQASGWRPEPWKVMLMDAAATSVTDGGKEMKELSLTQNSSSTGNHVVEGKEEKGRNSSKINSEVDAAGDKRKDRHQPSKYKTVSYRRIRRGNTRQRIDEFETMINS